MFQFYDKIWLWCDYTTLS